MVTLLQRNPFVHTGLIICFTLLLYGNILSNGWHLDDTGNILHNTPLHLTFLQLDTLFKTFYAHPESTGKLYRPISNFSFALNWFFGKDNPVGYHLVDISIHLLSAIILYLSCIQLLNTPALRRKNYSHIQKKNIALLAAILWLTAPIHTSAVTYIVQRMAQLASLFSVSAIFFYLQTRLTRRNSRVYQLTYLTGFLCCALLALASKENAILLFPSLALIEGIFFLQFAKIQNFAQQKRKIFFLLFLLLSGGILFLSLDIIAAQANSYGHRNFTFQERILTQPRILLFYLSQFFYPTASRLSIAHDITLSTSLFSPWQTLPAIAASIGLIIFGIMCIHKRALLSFAILYYFLNHLVESTIIPLELIFEHRNLLPSLFLFLPLSAFVSDKINEKKWVPVVVTIACTFFLVQSGLATINRNKAWRNTGTLNEDAVKKAPRNARAKLNLAGWYTQQKKYEEAFNLCEKAEKLAEGEASQNTIIPIARMQKGSIAYELGQTEKAAEYFQQAYSLHKSYTAAAEKLIAVLIELTRYDDALRIIAERSILKKDPKLLLLRASVFLRQGNPSEALASYRQAELFYRNLPLVTVGKGKASVMLGKHNEAAKLLNKAAQQNEPMAMLLQIENNLLASRKQEARAQLNQLLRAVPLIRLLNDLNSAGKDPFQIPLNTKLVRQAVLKAALRMSLNLDRQKNVE
ncbi:MAG: tetratricopeptide repeat protein [Candidatus Electrothrix sp. GW3-4]|uniref:tetratricopeptide repeat protein n=1 Tax=Candidatus Electrothrix sp. GW3-4 TaxID=3126740 RepID=UPI0030CAD946